jgi:hypothetical protein
VSRKIAVDIKDVPYRIIAGVTGVSGLESYPQVEEKDAKRRATGSGAMKFHPAVPYSVARPVRGRPEADLPSREVL